MQHLRPSSVGTSLSYYSPSLVLCSWDHLENKRIAGKTLSFHMATWGIALVSFTILQWLLSLRWLTEPQASTGQKSAFFCYLCFLTSLGVITAAKNVISYSILFVALLLKKRRPWLCVKPRSKGGCIAVAWQHIQLGSTPKCPMYCLGWGWGIWSWCILSPGSKVKAFTDMVSVGQTRFPPAHTVTEAVSGETKIKKLGVK